MRTINRLVASVLALALVATLLMIAVEIGLAALGNDPWLIPHDDWYLDGRSHAWDSAEGRTLAASVGAAGFLLLVLQVIRRRPLTLDLETTHSGIDTAIARNSLERAVTRAVLRVDGIVGAKSKASKRRVRVTAITRRHETRGLRARVEEAAANTVRSLHLAFEPSVHASVNSKRKR